MSRSVIQSRLKKFSPAQALMFYYAVAILAGALLLATPLAARGEALSFRDALFTATSGQCVTGLSVIDTGSRLSLFGQGVPEADAVVVAIGDRSHLSTLITLYLKELKVRRILVKAINEDHGRILERVDATDVICPEKDMAVRIAHSMSSPKVMEFIPLAEEYSLSETEPPKHFIGKTLVELDLRKKFNVTVIAIKDVLTDQFIPAPPANDLIKDSDVLILIGKTDDVDKAVRS